jgi:ABC-type sugar transport system permease subunit
MADVAVGTTTGAARQTRTRRKFQFAPIFATIPMIVIAVSVFFVAILFTIYWSFTKSGMFPGWVWYGTRQYEILWSTNNWQVAVSNIWLFAVVSLVINLLSASSSPCSWTRTSVARAFSGRSSSIPSPCRST